MELETVRDLDERIAAIRAQAAAELAAEEPRREAQARAAAAEAVGAPLTHLAGRMVAWGTAPVTPAFEGRARVIALVACALPVIAIIVALIIAA